jgi:tripartite-type tricarboxylate transporter receptor subunit TctC
LSVSAEICSIQAAGLCDARCAQSDLNNVIEEIALALSSHTLNSRRAGFAAVMLISACTNTGAAQSESASQADARTYPERPVRVIDAYSAGGGSDAVARLIAPKLSEMWGKQVVVENRPGASGAIGTELAVKAPPDGHTLLMGIDGSIAVNPTLFPNLAYDPQRDLVAVTQTSTQPMILVVHPTVPVTSVKELLARAKAQPGKINFASGGAGGTSHLAAELFKAMAKVDMTHVPYKGSAPAVIAVVGGEVQIMIGVGLPLLPHVNAGKLKALAVTTATRSNLLPAVPTVAQAGVPGYEAAGWNGLFAPANTPASIVAKVNRDVVKALNMPDVRDKLVSMGATPVGSSSEHFSAFVKQETARWGKVVRNNNIRAE